MDTETPKFIRPHQLAKMIGVSTVTLWRWRKERILRTDSQSAQGLLDDHLALLSDGLTIRI
jgi:hypothetical protein